MTSSLCVHRLQDLNGMIDAAKYCDLVLLLVDGAYGFEMETFEFLNILQVRTLEWLCCCCSPHSHPCAGAVHDVPQSSKHCMCYCKLVPDTS